MIKHRRLDHWVEGNTQLIGFLVDETEHLESRPVGTTHETELLAANPGEWEVVEGTLGDVIKGINTGG